jgi:hypothetical protein
MFSETNFTEGVEYKNYPVVMTIDRKYNQHIRNNDAVASLSPEDLDSLPLRILISKSPAELFSLRKIIINDYDRVRSRREWLKNIIELKYRNVIEELRRKVREYLRDPFGGNRIHYFLKDGNFRIKLEFLRLNNSKIILELTPANPGGDENVSH